MDATVNCTAAGLRTNGIPAFTQTNSTTKGAGPSARIEQQLWANARTIEYRYSDYGKWSTNFARRQSRVAADIKLHTQSSWSGCRMPSEGFKRGAHR